MFMPCISFKHYLDRVYSWGIHKGPFRSALHKLKNKRDIGLVEIMARNMVDLISEYSLKIDAVILVPLGRKRKQERGSNQSALLTRPIAYFLGLLYHDQMFKRVKKTRPQVGLIKQQRQDNSKDAFLAHLNGNEGGNFLLVDDMMTTGATLEAPAKALKQARAETDWSLTVAKARRSFYCQFGNI